AAPRSAAARLSPWRTSLLRASGKRWRIACAAPRPERGPATDQQAQRPQSAERQRGQRRRPAAHLDASVLAERDAPGRQDVAQAGQQMSAGVEPESEQTDGDAGAEEKGQHPAPARLPPEQRDQAGQQGHRGVGQRNPGAPRLAERPAMFEAQLAEQERCAAEQGGGEALVAIAHGFPGHGLTTISPAISSCPLPQKMSQWKGKVPSLSGAMPFRVTLPGPMFSSIL